MNWVLDADIRSFFDMVSQEWLVRFVERRVGDRRIIRLIQKWLKAGILEDEVVTVSERGTGQGSVISPPDSRISTCTTPSISGPIAGDSRRLPATRSSDVMPDDIVVGFKHEGRRPSVPRNDASTL